MVQFVNIYDTRKNNEIYSLLRVKYEVFTMMDTIKLTLVGKIF